MPPRNFYYTLAALTLVVTWSYGSTLLAAMDRWLHDHQYSHGYVIPLFSIYLLYHRRDMLLPSAWRLGETLSPSIWFVPFLVVALALRYLEARYYFNGLDPLSLVPMFMAVFLAVGGLPAFRWGWPSCLFLVFMVPLPYFLHTFMSTQLQTTATSMSTYILQTIGLPAVAEGTQIKIDNAAISVVEACSGLGMIVTFVALSVAAVLIIKSEWWVKAGLLLGAIPLSLICNVIRISVVAVTKYWGYDYDTVEMVHTFAGFAMLIVGAGLIFVELYVLERIVIPQGPSRAGDDPLTLPYGVALSPRATS